MSWQSPVEKPVWDVIIVGAGPAGCASAITLARFGWRVLIVEARLEPRFKLGESIAPGAVGLVRHFLNNTTFITDSGQGSFYTRGNLSLWAGTDPDITDFFYTPEQYGLCVDRLLFDRSLRNEAVKAGAQLMLGSRFADCTRLTEESTLWRVVINSNNESITHQSRYLLDCSGRTAVIGRCLGLARHLHDALFSYAQWYVTDTLDNDRYTRIEATQNGWWYSNRLPTAELGTSKRLMVFQTDADLPVAKIAAQQTGFEQLLSHSRHMGPLLSTKSYASVNERIRGAPAGSQCLQEFGGRGWLAVGDAAQAYDPLSSQGIWKALETASHAGHIIHYCLQSGNNYKKADEFIQQYLDHQNRLWNDYISQKDFFYAQQPFWRNQPFWARRAF